MNHPLRIYDVYIYTHIYIFSHFRIIIHIDVEHALSCIKPIMFHNEFAACRNSLGDTAEQLASTDCAGIFVDGNRLWVCRQAGLVTEQYAMHVWYIGSASTTQ